MQDTPSVSLQVAKISSIFFFECAFSLFWLFDIVFFT